MNTPALRCIRALQPVSVAAAARAARSNGPAGPALLSARSNLSTQRRASSSLPTVAQSSFWKSLVPKPLRRQADGTRPVVRAVADARKAKEWNPATFYIFMFLFIGSMAIQMIATKKDFETFMRQSDVKIGLLREVLERVQKGEDVDVEGLLGTGDPAKEAEWEAEIARDEASRGPKDKKAAEPPAAPSREAPAAGPRGGPERPERPVVKVASATSFY